jgi:hypothetical protein
LLHIATHQRIWSPFAGECPPEAWTIESRCYELLPGQYDWVGAVAACANVRQGAAPLAIETEDELDVLKPWLLEVLESKNIL